MADEAVKITLLGNHGDPIECIIANGAAGTNIEKGTVMRLSSSPNTVAAGASGGTMMGILAEEKVGGDGKTSCQVITHCIADLTCGAAETAVLGEPVIMGAAANEIDVQTSDTIEDSRLVVGVSLETIGNNGTGAILINVGRIR